MDPPAEPTSAFFRTELSRALQECGFGILAWEVPDETASAQGISPHGTTPVEAIASVTLLSDEAEQGNTIEVHLNIRGYKAIFTSRPAETLAPAAGIAARQYFETLDDLLCHISPVFQRRRTKLLFAKLEDVARERSWNG